jgi:hypothetical protein
MAIWPVVLLLLALPAARPLPCGEHEILLRNRTCMCPFFRYNGRCMRRRYQATVNTTLGQMQSAARHLLAENLLLTIDATNHEAMVALGASLMSVGTVVTAVVDGLDMLVGGEPSATMEITNASVAGAVLTVTVDYRLPAVDFFFWFVHFGASPAPCPPFDAMDRCCVGDMGQEFQTHGVDCSGDPVGQMERFIARWGGEHDPGQRRFTLSFDLPGQVPAAVFNGGSVYRLGVGMVVFGRLAQNTESRVEVHAPPPAVAARAVVTVSAQVQLNNSVTATSVGALQFSGIEYSRLQLETCGGRSVSMHMVVKAAGIRAVQSMRYQTGDDPQWRVPACGDQGCNVSIDSDFVDIRAPLPAGYNASSSATLYVLLSRGLVLTRVVARASGEAIERCKAPVVIRPSGQRFAIDVLQGDALKYSGSAGFVQLTDVAALTLRVRAVNSTAYRYTIDNISVVYSLVDSALIMDRMPDGRVTPQLEALCEQGDVCLIETLMERGRCVTHEKCEDQGQGGVFVMPMYPWGRETLKTGTYTALLAEIKEVCLPLFFL